MANANVEKLKTFGLRHGEKIVVGVVAALSVGMLAMAFITPTIQTTPADVQNAASAAKTNIQRNATPEDIQNKLVADGIKEGGFLAIVETNKPGAKSAGNYRLAGDFVSPEPGAGLIRDMPELIAVTNLLAHSGRGSTMMYVLDENNNRMYEDPNAPTEKKPTLGKKKKKSSSGYAGMGGMPGSGGQKKSSQAEKDEEKKRLERDQARLRGQIAGKISTAPKEKADEPEGKPKEALQGLRWASIVGELDHKLLRESYAKALKTGFANANPHYLRLDLQRQSLQDDGSWPGDDAWEQVDREENRLVLDNVVEQEKEITLEESRLEGLVDLLPFLRSGYWRSVHLASLVPEEATEILRAKPKPAVNSSSMMPGGMGDMMMQEQMMMQQQQQMETSAGSMSMGEMGMMPGMMGGGMGAADFPTSNADTLMIRALDFTVQPDMTYRYHVRLVVKNPNYKADNVAPGIDNKSEELFGPWSEATNPLTVPADVSTYALQQTPLGANPSGEKVDFRVVRWTPDDGLTVYKQFTAGPGDIIGERASTQVPDADGKKPVPKMVDYTSHQVVLDTTGGSRPLDRLKLPGSRFIAPTQALVSRYDGALVVRDQARDAHNDEMAELMDIYDQTMEDVKAGKKKSTGSDPMMDMMPGAMP
ncbi:MAG: hypothetical protein ABI353_18355 [Isosphaeraceae bacterium]